MSELNFNIHGDADFAGDVAGGNITKNIFEAAPPPALSLHQLPAPPRDFTGREAELEKLRAALKTGGVTISGLHGLGGVGKTALALKLASELLAEYPDAQFYIDLRGAAKQEPLTPAQAQAHIIRAYFPENKLPDDEAELSKLYHSVLHNKRALLVLDNAHDAAQVAPLLPPISTFTLITSRQNFHVDGLQFVHLGTLKPIEATELIVKIAPRLTNSPENVASIAELCGYLPLALRAAASLLAETIDLEPAYYAEQLENEIERLNLTALKAEGYFISVRASFNLSYRNLQSEAQRVFRCLAVFPSDFDAEAEEKICEDINHQQLSLLTRWSLVEYNQTIKRYHLHDLVRLFASEQLANGERFDASMKNAVFYGNLLFKLNVLYRDQPKQLLKALSVFDLEADNFWAGHGWLTSNLTNHPAIPNLLSTYSDEPYILGLRLKPSERVYWILESLKASMIVKDRRFECIHLGNLGLAHRDSGELDLALDKFNKQLAIALEINDIELELDAKINSAMIYDESSRTQKAIKIYEECLPKRRKTQNRTKLANLLNNLGNSYSKIGNREQSKLYSDEAFEIRKLSGDPAGIFSSILNNGVTFLENGQIQIALEKFNEALHIAKEIGNKQREAYASINIALCYKATNRTEDAYKNAEIALSLAEREQEHQLSQQIRKLLEEWNKERPQ